MNQTKTLVALAIGVVIFAMGLMGGLILQADVIGRTPNQNNSLARGFEKLQVNGYTPRLLTEYAVEFNLENNGTSDIQIADVELNGYSNQSTNGMTQGWNGTTFLAPGQMGILYVYAPAYTYVIDQTMPQLPTNPTQTELENFEAWTYSYNSTFTFVTSTAGEYNYTIPGLGYGMAYAITTWTSSTTYSFTGSSSLTITNVTFSGITGIATNNLILSIKNTGTEQVTVGQVKVNNVIMAIDGSSTLTYSAGTNGTITLDNVGWANGNPYAINMYDGSGNGVGSTQQNAPGAGAQVGVVLYVANVDFYGNGTIIDIDVGNSGTSDTTITQVYIGTSTSAMDNQTIIPVSLPAGTVQRITLDFSWQPGVVYYFNVLASTGQQLPFTEQAPNTLS
jgi:hypothetical protein